MDGEEEARACFDRLFQHCYGFSRVRMDPDLEAHAQHFWPHLARDTEAYIAARPELSPLCVRLLRKNAALEGPLHECFREYLWSQVMRRLPSVQIEDLFTAIVQVGWREHLAYVRNGLDDDRLANEAAGAWHYRDEALAWNEEVFDRFFPCVRAFRERSEPYVETIDRLAGDARDQYAPTFLTRDAFLTGRAKNEKRWALAALGIGRPSRMDAPPYVNEGDVLYRITSDDRA